MVDLVLYAAVGSPLVALLIAVVVYLRRHSLVAGRTRRSAAFFSAGALGAGVVLGYIAFVYLPWPLCEAFASSLGGGWCGLTTYISGPLGFTVGTVIFTAIWARTAVRPNSAMDSDTYSAALRAPSSARHRER